MSVLQNRVDRCETVLFSYISLGHDMNPVDLYSILPKTCKKVWVFVLRKHK